MYDQRTSRSSHRRLRYALVDSAHGWLLVIMSGRGVVDVMRGDSEDLLLERAACCLPGVRLVPDCGIHARWVATVAERFKMSGTDAIAPVDQACGYRLVMPG